MTSENVYRAMTYSAVATMFFYSDGIDTTMNTVEDFREHNALLVQRVFDEILSVFNYELSWHQMDAAIVAYCSTIRNPQNVNLTEVYNPKG